MSPTDNNYEKNLKILRNLSMPYRCESSGTLHVPRNFSSACRKGIAFRSSLSALYKEQYVWMMPDRVESLSWWQYYMEGKRARRYGFSRESMDRSGVIPRDWIT